MMGRGFARTARWSSRSLSAICTAALVGRIEETVKAGRRIVVAFQPDQPRDDGRPLDQGIAYVVVTMREGRVIELKGCADRAAAMTYAQTGTVQS